MSLSRLPRELVMPPDDRQLEFKFEFREPSSRKEETGVLVPIAARAQRVKEKTLQSLYGRIIDRAAHIITDNQHSRE